MPSLSSATLSHVSATTVPAIPLVSTGLQLAVRECVSRPGWSCPLCLPEATNYSHCQPVRIYCCITEARQAVVLTVTSLQLLLWVRSNLQGKALKRILELLHDVITKMSYMWAKSYRSLFLHGSGIVAPNLFRHPKLQHVYHSHLDMRWLPLLVHVLLVGSADRCRCCWWVLLMGAADAGAGGGSITCRCQPVVTNQWHT